jgi:hypothetical protein
MADLTVLFLQHAHDLKGTEAHGFVD